MATLGAIITAIIGGIVYAIKEFRNIKVGGKNHEVEIAKQEGEKVKAIEPLETKLNSLQ